MWYIVVLLTWGVWSNCWAMNESTIVTIYKDKPVMEDGRNFSDNRDILVNIAKEYHEERLTIEKKDEASIYARCLAYLKAHEDTVALAISNNGNVILHGFENKLVAIDYVNKKPAQVIEPRASDGKNLDAALTFVACSIQYEDGWWACFGPDRGWRYIAVDNAGKIHDWDARIGDGRYIDDWKKTVPGSVTAIRATIDTTVIFYKDDTDNLDHVGFMLQGWNDKIIKSIFVPIEDAKDVTHVQMGEKLKLEEYERRSDYYNIFSTDGSWVTYQRRYWDDSGDDHERDCNKWLKKVNKSSCTIQ